MAGLASMVQAAAVIRALMMVSRWRFVAWASNVADLAASLPVTAATLCALTCRTSQSRPGHGRRDA
eukprot:6592869-Prymnesium_polylepis.1